MFILLLFLFTTQNLCWAAKFTNAGPYSFDYLLGESKNFSTRASVVFLDYEIQESTIQNLKKSGKTVICYVSVGSYEEWRPDAKSFPASVLGKDYAGWPGEKWLDVRKVDVLLPIMESRFDLAAKKGCEGIDPDNMDVYLNDSGFKINKTQQLTYNRAILRAIRKRGMMSGLKNGGTQARDLLPLLDFAVSEQCAQYKECSNFDILIKNRKPVFVIEYTGRWSAAAFRKDVCPLGKTNGMSFILKKLNLKNDYTISCI